MIHLETTDALELVSSSAANLDVLVGFANLNGTTVTPDKQATAISSATTTTVLTAPGAGINKIKNISIRNKHASTSNDVTIQFDLSGTNYECYKTTLLAGETLEWAEGVGWYTLKAAGKLNAYRWVDSDYVNATTSFSDITGLTCPIEAGKHYCFEAQLYHFANATTSGPRFAVNGPAMTGMRIASIITEAGGVAAAVMNANVGDVTALETAVAATTDSTTTLVMSIMSGWVNPSASGTFAIRGASEVAVAAGLTVKKGSWLQIWEVPQG